MRRFLRHLLTFSAAASLLLCIAVCVLWVRTDGIAYDVLWLNSSEDLDASNHGGGLKEATVTLESTAVGLRVDYTVIVERDPAAIPYDWLRWPAGQSAKYRRFDPVHSTSLGAFRLLGRQRYGFAFEDELIDTPTHWERGRDVLFPHWCPVLLTALLPGCWLVALLRRVRQRRNLRRGICPNCGYDLRASPDRCPECGTPAPG